MKSASVLPADIRSSLIELLSDCRHHCPSPEVSRFRKAASSQCNTSLLRAIIAATRGLLDSKNAGNRINLENICLASPFELCGEIVGELEEPSSQTGHVMGAERDSMGFLIRAELSATQHIRDKRSKASDWFGWLHFSYPSLFVCQTQQFEIIFETYRKLCSNNITSSSDG